MGKKNMRQKIRKKCGAIPGSKACKKQANNGGRYCSGCPHNPIRY